MRLGDNHIGSEHMLLGLIDEGEGVGAQILAGLGVDLDQLRDSVLQTIQFGDGPRGVSTESGSRASMRSSEPRLFGPQSGFELLNDDARHVVVLAGEEALRLSHNFVGTEHLLLGLLRADEGIAFNALTDLGITLEAARWEVETIIGRTGVPLTEAPPLTPRTRKVLDLSLREACQFERDDIGTEHILLGLVREGEGVAS